MAIAATTVAIKAQSAERVGRGVEEALSKLSRPGAAVVFVSGSLCHQLPEIAARAAARAAGTPLAIVAGTGVLTERGEIEDQAAAAVLAWSGPKAQVLSVAGSNADDVGQGLARQLSDRLGRAQPAGLLFVRPDGFGPHVFEPLQQLRGARHLFGAGTLAGMDTYAVDAEGRVHEGAAVTLLLGGEPPPRIRTSPACRLLMPLRRISEIRGANVVSIEGEPALDVLSQAGQDLPEQPLIFAVLADEPELDATGRPELLVRAVQGVDPIRRSLVISDEVREGLRIAFAVRDASAARADLETAVRDLERELAGAIPRFGVYINCAGRGSSLYGAYDVDSRIVRARFSQMPFAGMQSSFEIAPHMGQPTLQLYTGVLALFASLS